MTRYFTFILSLTLGCSAFSQRLIFNERDLSGWKIFGTEKWYVEKRNIGL